MADALFLFTRVTFKVVDLRPDIREERAKSLV